MTSHISFVNIKGVLKFERKKCYIYKCFKLFIIAENGEGEGNVNCGENNEANKGTDPLS